MTKLCLAVFFLFMAVRPAPAQVPPAGVIVLRNQNGGAIALHERLFAAVRASGNSVEIHGRCPSACTLVVTWIPKERLCFNETAWLGFHQTRLPNGAVSEATGEFSQSMIDSYPEDIRAWLEQRGGLEKLPYGGYWAISASELWKMGYRKCEEGKSPSSISQGVLWSSNPRYGRRSRRLFPQQQKPV